MIDYSEIVVVLDRSGSMHGIKDDIIGGFNSFVKDQRSNSKITLIQFDTQNSYEVIYEAKNANKAPKLTSKQYVPRAGTPMNDAIGRAITETGQRLSDIKRKDRPSNVVMVIISDGMENASKEYTAKDVAKMIKHQTNKYDWQFVYLGANQDAILEGSKRGISNHNSGTWDPTSKGIREAFKGTASNVAAYSCNGLVGSLSYSDKQRKSMKS